MHRYMAWQQSQCRAFQVSNSAERGGDVNEMQYVALAPCALCKRIAPNTTADSQRHLQRIAKIGLTKCPSFPPVWVWSSTWRSTQFSPSSLAPPPSPVWGTYAHTSTKGIHTHTHQSKCTPIVWVALQFHIAVTVSSCQHTLCVHAPEIPASPLHHR